MKKKIVLILVYVIAALVFPALWTVIPLTLALLWLPKQINKWKASSHPSGCDGAEDADEDVDGDSDGCDEVAECEEEA